MTALLAGLSRNFKFRVTRRFTTATNRSDVHPPEPRRRAARSRRTLRPSFSPERSGAAGGAAKPKLQIRLNLELPEPRRLASCEKLGILPKIPFERTMDYDVANSNRNGLAAAERRPESRPELQPGVRAKKAASPGWGVGALARYALGRPKRSCRRLAPIFMAVL